MSVIALASVLVLGVAYLMLGFLRQDPTRSTIQVEVELIESGGLLPDQDVTLRGVAVGRVESVDIHQTGVRVRAAIDADVKIPLDGAVRVASLSPVGEQFLDFESNTDSGPYLTDGAVIDSVRTSTPIPMATLLTNLEPMLGQIQPEQLETIMTELGTGTEGVGKLTDIVQGGSFLVSTLDAVLPQTVGIVRSSRVVLPTLADTAPGLQSTSVNLGETLHGLQTMDGGLRTFLDQTPSALNSIDALFADNSPTMVQLLGNLATVSQMAYVRVPALEEFFFPTERAGSTLDAIATVFHDGGIWGNVDAYPRLACDYPLPRSAPSRPDFPEPFLNTQCPNDQLLVRGAAAAPRPAGDDTDRAPAGSDPQVRSDPTPQGPNTLPTPYAGPDINFN